MQRGCTAAASRNSVHNVNKDRPEPYEYVKHVYNYNIICIPIYQYICTHFVQMPTLVGPVMFRLMIVRRRPESGNSTYVTGRRPTRGLEVQ